MNYYFPFLNKLILFLLLVLVIFQWALPVKAAGKKLIPVVRWTMISLAAIYPLRLLFNMPHIPWPGRFTGPYAWAYIVMTISNCLLPFILLLRRPGNNIYFLLLMAIMMNIGWIFELLIIWLYYFLS